MGLFVESVLHPPWRGFALCLLGAVSLLGLMSHQPHFAGTLWLGIVALWLTVLGLLDGLALGKEDTSPAVPLLRRPSAKVGTGGWVFVIASLVLLPTLGAFGLSDPWETHYGEVAREILARDDWISLWWAQDNWFWSKPILIFWLEALSMGLLGVNIHPGGNPAHPEWAIRFPHYVLAIAALLSVYLLVARVWSKRTGVLCALVLLSSPYFFLISHQAITDLPLVTLMTISVCLLTMGLTESHHEKVRMYRAGPWRLSGQHMLIGAVSFLVLPQILYLASRNITLGASGFGFHTDTFLYGSAGNSGLPGNPVHQIMQPVYRAWAYQPIAQAFYWLLAFAILVWRLTKVRDNQSLYMYGFYLCCALGLMAKGLPGVLLPGLISLFYLLVARRWSLLLDGRLRIASGALLVMVCGLPWYVAMHIRHGSGFLDRILVHDHLNRLASGVHGDTGTIQYFIEQLGVGLFPWVAFVPAAIGYAIIRVGRLERAAAPRARLQDHVLLVWGLWLVCGFVLFSAMVTKFHHYAFPVVPPAAFLTGITVDRLLAKESVPWKRRDWLALGVLGVGCILCVTAVSGWFGQVRGAIPVSIPVEERGDYVLLHAWNPWIVAGVLILALVCFVIAYKQLRALSTSTSETPLTHIAALIVGAVLLAFVGRDLSWITDSRPAGYERLMWLFIYRYERPWPTQFDYRPILTGFSIVLVSALGLALFKKLRSVALYGFVGVALCFAVWSLDVYLIDVGAHWTQRNLIKRYYALRKGPEEPIVSWQMNWKGETFYTGNRLPAFLDARNKDVEKWFATHQDRRVFVVLEPSRLGSFKRMIRRPVMEHSTLDDCNKFLLVSVDGAQRPMPTS